jgi:hypothetical protein
MGRGYHLTRFLRTAALEHTWYSLKNIDFSAIFLIMNTMNYLLPKGGWEGRGKQGFASFLGVFSRQWFWTFGPPWLKDVEWFRYLRR